jgi:hypothetical protein
MQTEPNFDDIINSINQIQRADAPNFFVTRAQARLDKYLEPSKTWMPVQRPAWIIASLSLLFMVNLYLVNASKTKQNYSQKSYNNEEKSINDFAINYDLNTSTNY